MLDPGKIVMWLDGHLQSMRRSRRKMLAAAVHGAVLVRAVDLAEVHWIRELLQEACGSSA